MPPYVRSMSTEAETCVITSPCKRDLPHFASENSASQNRRSWPKMLVDQFISIAVLEQILADGAEEPVLTIRAEEFIHGVVVQHG